MSEPRETGIPMSMIDPSNNSYEGFDIDVVTQLAADMGVELELIPTDWKSIVAGHYC